MSPDVKQGLMLDESTSLAHAPCLDEEMFGLAQKRALREL
jgi:hypothetical protein